MRGGEPGRVGVGVDRLLPRVHRGHAAPVPPGARPPSCVRASSVVGVGCGSSAASREKSAAAIFSSSVFSTREMPWAPWATGGR